MTSLVEATKTEMMHEINAHKSQVIEPMQAAVVGQQDTRIDALEEQAKQLATSV
jgi:hypothetical protein